MQRQHDLDGYARSIEQSDPSHCYSELRYPAINLNGYYSRTRYPDEYDPPEVPSNKFSPEQAREAVQNARKILEIIRNIVLHS